MQIVIVDSSRVVLQIIASLIEPRGHAVHPFTDSERALEFLAATPAVRVLITSLEVRPLCGLELCWSARLLAESRGPLHVITMSSARNVRSLAEALDSGADDFIEKPPSAEELNARLRAAERLTTMQEELIRLAETDPLTGSYNRRAFFKRARAAAARDPRPGAVSAILLDIDHFKRINDEHGHDVGDVAIKAVAELIAGAGIAGRLGGEEFAVILPGGGLAEAVAQAERLRADVQALRIGGARGPIALSCSFGVSTWRDGDSVEALVKRADVALYAAKGGGRNRVVPDHSEGIRAVAG
ncbi:diguanylate cyclase (GGDEF) domain-containing protein [Methylobacterium sp. 275MFSha3.1]|uniref:GGDEF domain-containing protein n=1 Tax=Methylobacterium sp. 275MFSha3.1 TaxID=1502746 RepID=UPI0008A80B37|nr:diguanylate cyclase [Methylobacterium sp. 275MFSha3.1]SEH47842.1 diguanylate cyclase (GGDEF) domain-containing protein [Methylobacterium sp. 275MFSha3.1]